MRTLRSPGACLARLVAAATAMVLTIAAATVLAQFGSFDPVFEGQLWAVRQQLSPPDDGMPAGLAFVNGTMFVADMANRTVVAYDNAGSVIAMPGAEWDTTDPLSPVFGLVPDQLAAVIVTVDGADRDTLFISDAESNRVAVFDAANGSYLFTLRLERPTASPTVSLGIGQMAMSAGAKFHFNTIASTLTLTGSFAAAWREQQTSGTVYSGALAFLGASSVFPSTGSEFVGSASSVLTGTEADPAAPAPQYVFGVTFDTTGNLYVLDAFNERLHVYDPAFAPLFTFGTPVAGGGTAEFHEPWGLAFWPDSAGTSGRLFINDTYNSRILIYRPVDGGDADAVIDGLEFETVVENFVAPAPAIELYSIAIDPPTGTVAVTDFAQPRVVVLQKPRLAAFNVELLDNDGTVISGVCSGADYRVRFSLTVPAGLAPVTDVTPTLLIDGVPSSIAPVPAAVYPSATLSAGEVMTFTYAMPGTATDVNLVAGATATNTTDILSTSATVFVSNCAAESDPTSFDAQPNIPAQVSGWTPVLAGQTFAIALSVQDDDGLDRIQYELEGANRSAGIVTMPLDDGPLEAHVDVAFPEFGRTTMRYRARDGNGIWSAWLSIDVRTKEVINRTTNENAAVEFRVGDPEGTGITYTVSALPAGVSFDANTGQFAGVVSFDANQPYSADPVLSSGIYNVVVTETASGGATSTVGFTWTINHINREPIIANPPIHGLSIQQGQLFEVKIDGADPDGDPVIFTMSGHSPSGRDLPPTITIDAASGQISGFFPLDSDPSYDIFVGLAECGVQTPDPPCDRAPLPGNHLATLFGFEVAVVDANLPPDIINPGLQSSAEGAVVTLPVQSSDAEGDALIFAATGLPAGLSIDPATGVISGTVSFAAAGAYAVTVAVDDQVNAPAPSVTFAWIVTDTNRPPVVTIPDRLSVEDETLTGGISLAAFASDPEGSPLTFVSAAGLPPGISMNATGALSGSLDFDSAGVYVVTVRVSDGALFTDQAFTWTVLNRNRAPVLSPSNQSNVEGDFVSYQVPAGDPDGDALIFSINGLPAGLSLNTSSGLISGTLGSGSAGTYQVNIGVGDVATGSLSVLKTFTWTITIVPSNVPPVCSAASGGEIWPPNHKKFYAAPITGVSDADGDPIAITVTAILQDEKVDSSGDGQFAPDGRIESGQAWIRAERNGHGDKASGNGRVYEILFTASDGNGGSCTGSVLWTVPHNQGRSATAIDDGVRYDSTSAVSGTTDKNQLHQKSPKP